MTAFLYLIILTGGSSIDQIRRYEFSSMELCDKSLKAMRIDNKKETTISAFCANEKNQRNYNATWWNDQIKDSSK